MKSLKEIRKDLAEIRTYYSNIRGKCEGEKVGVHSCVQDLASKYNVAISKAPAELYAFYCAMYIEGNTLESLADKWGYSIQSMYYRNKKLKAYFQQTLN